MTGFSWDKLKEIVTLGCAGGSGWELKRKGVNVYEILWSSSLRALHNVIVSQDKKGTKEKGFFSLL